MIKLLVFIQETGTPATAENLEMFWAVITKTEIYEQL
jgi:hypothetical protein